MAVIDDRNCLQNCKYDCAAPMTIFLYSPGKAYSVWDTGITLYHVYNDRLIDCCLTSSEQYFSHLEDENKYVTNEVHHMRCKTQLSIKKNC